MPLLWLSLAFVVGIWLGDYFGWSLVTWAILSGASLCAGLVSLIFKRRWAGFPDLTVRLPNPDGFPASFIPLWGIVFTLALGGLRFQMTQPCWDEGFIASYNDLPVRVNLQGLVVQAPDLRDQYIQLTLAVNTINLDSTTGDRPVTGLVLARLPPGGDWRYGDRIELLGSLETPPEGEGFSYRTYLMRRGIYSYIFAIHADQLAREQGNPLLAWLFKLREQALSSLQRLFPDPEASLLAGILLGVESEIPPEVSQAFRDSGTAHIIAISGFNMAIVAGLFTALFGRLLGRRRGALAAIIAIVLYTLLVGASASVVRAAIMSGLAVFAAQVGRRGNGLNTLAITAALMVFFNPNLLWDIGFQLSFMATLGLVLYAGPLSEAFLRLGERVIPQQAARRLGKPVSEYLLFTLAAMLTTLPISFYYFQRFPLLSPLANLFVLPAQPAVMILGGFAMLLGMLADLFGQAAAYLAWPFVAYTIRMAEFWAQFKNTIISLQSISSLAIFSFYALLFLLTFGLPAWRARRQARLAATQAEIQPALRMETLRTWLNRSSAPLLSATLAGLALATVLVWRSAVTAPDGRLHLIMIDTGSGEGLLVQTPGGRNVLINGGASPSRLSDALGRRLPLDQRRLDYLVVAGGEDEQIAALPRLLERYPVDQVLWSGPTGGTRAASQLQASLAESSTPVTTAESGQILDLGDGARLQVVSANARGAVLLLEWENFRAFLPLGLDRQSLDTLLSDPDLPPTTLLLLSGGGYAPLNPPALIDKLRPQLVLLSVAAGDWRNLPDEKVIEAVEGYSLLRTDHNGWVEISTDGKLMWVEVEK